MFTDLIDKWLKAQSNANHDAGISWELGKITTLPSMIIIGKDIRIRQMVSIVINSYGDLVWVCAIASGLIWLFLALFWGQFWRRLELEPSTESLDTTPTVWAIVPARDEADVIETSLKSLLTQDYGGDFKVVLVDDNSSDDTTTIAQQTAQNLGKTEQLQLLNGQPLAKGWKGKLWALAQGVDHAKSQNIPVSYFLFTDADIEHHSTNLSELVTKAETAQLDLVSLMVLLRCDSYWEKLLIPAFVYFFQQLYPFRLANNPQLPLAAAAGGCILIRARTLEQIGGIASVKDALIDDCTLAKKVKSSGGETWLGLTAQTLSLRPYESLRSIWDMVARTAFDQLSYSWLLLLATVLGMSLVYLVPPICLVWGLITGSRLQILVGFLTWLVMSLTYLPTLQLYQLSWWRTLLLPAIAFLYELMTIDSAIRHLQGKGGLWKGRTY